VPLPVGDVFRKIGIKLTYLKKAVKWFASMSIPL